MIFIIQNKIHIYIKYTLLRTTSLIGPSPHPVLKISINDYYACQ